MPNTLTKNGKTYLIFDFDCGRERGFADILQSKDLDLKKSLTDEECMEVLIHCQKNLDWSFGFGWDNIYWVIEEFYKKKEK